MSSLFFFFTIPKKDFYYTVQRRLLTIFLKTERENALVQNEKSFARIKNL